MADDPRRPERPDYNVYRSRRRFGRGGAPSDGDGLAELRRAPAQRPGSDPPPYGVHRAGAGRRGGLLRGRPRVPGIRPARRLTGRLVLRWILTAALAWILLSAVVFLSSAQIQESRISDNAEAALASGGFTLTSPNTILVLGSDARTKETAEPGSRVGGPSRSDSILLVRAGGGASARLSIPRDTVADIPGHGRDKVNAAYAIGGAALAVTTVEGLIDAPIHHVVEVDFENFPALIDAMGGIDIRTGCVVSRINGGSRNGGYTLRLRGGENHIDGKQALALARTRKNDCNRRENDFTRARRQQKILGAMRSRLLSPATFVRLPWVAWRAPQAIRSDMAGPSLLGLFAAMAAGGNPPTQVLAVTPGAGTGLAVDEARAERQVERFLQG